MICYVMNEPRSRSLTVNQDEQGDEGDEESVVGGLVRMLPLPPREQLGVVAAAMAAAAPPAGAGRVRVQVVVIVVVIVVVVIVVIVVVHCKG